MTAKDGTALDFKALLKLGEVNGDRLGLRAAYEAPNGTYVRAERTGATAEPDRVIDEVAAAIESALAVA